ncbi:MAG: hypothetical protein ACYC1D_16075 [Acidimicrobiales bacterium]
MSPLRAPTNRGAPTRIGQARPSHLVTTAGVGAVIDLPSMSVVVRGLHAWSPEHTETVVEPRLLDEVRRVLGPQVRSLRQAPWSADAADDGWTKVGVPVSPFPRWVRCPRCYRLGPLDPPGQFELVHRYGRRPDLAKWVHARCQNQPQVAVGRRRPCLPARFLVVCEEGHLDDFPYVEFVHQGATQLCGGAKLALSDSASTLGPRSRCAAPAWRCAWRQGFLRPTSSPWPRPPPPGPMVSPGSTRARGRQRFAVRARNWTRSSTAAPRRSSPGRSPAPRRRGRPGGGIAASTWCGRDLRRLWTRAA